MDWRVVRIPCWTQNGGVGTSGSGSCGFGLRISILLEDVGKVELKQHLLVINLINMKAG